MPKPLCQVSRKLLLLVIATLAVSSVGCRSTRQGISHLPGMAWVAPSDEESFGQWSEADEPNLTTPSTSATPQLTTKSGTSAPISAQDPSARGSKPAASSAASPALSQTTPDLKYPDTGYPPLQQPTPPIERGGTGYATGAYDAGGSRPQAKDSAADENGVLPQPQRGFYGDRYATDEVAAPNASNSQGTAPASRYGAPDGKADGLGSVEEDRGYSRYGSHDDLPRSRYTGETGADSPIVSDEDHGYDPHGGQAYDPSLEQGPDLQRYDDELATEGTGDERDTGLSATGRKIGQELRDDYRQTTEELRGRLENSASSVSEATRELTNNVQDAARQAGQQVQRGITGVGRGLQEGYHRAANPWEDESHSPDAASDTDTAQHSGAIDGSHDGEAYPEDVTQAPGASPLNGDTAGTPTSRFSSSPDAPPATSTRPRSNQPWRPGSTGSYPNNGLDQTRSPYSGAERDVAPASFRTDTGSESRLMPAYR